MKKKLRNWLCKKFKLVKKETIQQTIYHMEAYIVDSPNQEVRKAMEDVWKTLFPLK